MGTREQKELKNVQYPKRGGYYYFDIDGKEYKLPSVTTILKVLGLSKEPLMGWASKETAKIALDDPTLSVQEVTHKFRQFALSATTRGRGVHNLYEYYIQKQVPPPDTELYAEYADGIHAYIKDLSPKHILHKKVVKSLKYGYAGELDTIDEINGQKWLIDIKTGGSYKEHELQLAAYRECLAEEGIYVDKTGILLLPGDGTYQLLEKHGDLDIFHACLKIWKWSQ